MLERGNSQRSVRTLSGWQVRQPVYQTSKGKWRAYEKQLQPLSDAIGPYVESYERELEALTIGRSLMLRASLALLLLFAGLSAFAPAAHGATTIARPVVRIRQFQPGLSRRQRPADPLVDQGKQFRRTRLARSAGKACRDRRLSRAKARRPADRPLRWRDPCHRQPVPGKLQGISGHDAALRLLRGRDRGGAQMGGGWRFAASARRPCAIGRRFLGPRARLRLRIPQRAHCADNGRRCRRPAGGHHLHARQRSCG